MIYQLTIYLLSQLIFNIINAYFDAYRILKNKTIAHLINFGLYGIIVGIQLYLSNYNWWFMILFCVQAFFNRQVTFDIPLNLRRRKNDKSITWDYISKARPPKAITDRIEISIFGYNGRAITISYIILTLVSISSLFILL